jgi:hypothetical protein
MTTLSDHLTTTQHLHRTLNRPNQRRRIANMGAIDRSLAGVLGAGLIGFGSTRRTLPAIISSIAGGGALLAMSATGYCPFYHALNIDNARKGTANQTIAGRVSLPSGASTDDSASRFMVRVVIATKEEVRRRGPNRLW